MLNLISTINTSTVTTGDYVLYTLISLVLGAIIAVAFRYKSKSTKGFTITLALIPAIVQVVIMLVNGNLGTGIAVMGAFSLIKFRSIAGNAKDICGIFLAMAVGLAMGTQYVLIALLLTVIICLANLIYSSLPFGDEKFEKKLIVTIPESLDYTEIFDDLFDKYTESSELALVKTTNLGSMYKLTYNIILKDKSFEKALIDDMRCRNGNLEISCGRVVSNTFDQL